MRSVLVLLAAAAVAGCAGGGGTTTVSTRTTTESEPETTSATTADTGTDTGTAPPPPQTAPAPPENVAGLHRGGTLGATRLRGTARCEQTAERRAVADLTWRPAERRGEEQLVVVALDPAAFADGSFERSRALAPDVAVLLWPRVRGESVHTWIVLTRHGSTWTASAPARFEGEACEADFQRPR
jgi:hypothetical protein